MGTIIGKSGRNNVSIREFLKSAKAGNSGVKYAAEAGARHWFFVPQQEVVEVDELGNSSTFVTTFSEMHWVHEWRDNQKHFKSALCLTEERKQVCPFCNRVGDAWDVYRDRYDRMFQNCLDRGMTKEQAEFYMRGDKNNKNTQSKGAYAALMDERKMREARPYFYMLIALFDVDVNNTPVLENGLPKFELKVMRMTQSRVDDLLKQLASADGNIERQEITIDYPNMDDPAMVVGQSTTSIVFPNVRITAKYPQLIQKIEEEAAQFEWTALNKSFNELTEYSTEGAEKICEEQFRLWDAHTAALSTNPNDKYLEYQSDVMDAPALNAGQPNTQWTGAALPNNAAGVPGYNNVPAPAGAIPAGAPVAGQPGVPPVQAGAPAGDVNQQTAQIQQQLAQQPAQSLTI